MKHFVGCSSQGFLYESRGGDLEVRPEYVGQVIDETPVVGAGMQQEDKHPVQQSKTNWRSMTTNPPVVHSMVQMQHPNVQLHAPSPIAAQPQQSWAPTQMGYYASPGPLGGVPGIPWQPYYLPQTEYGPPPPVAVCPEYLAEACALMDCAESEIWGASGDWGDGDLVGTIVAPWCVCRETARQKCWQHQNAQAARKNRPHTRAGQPVSTPSGSIKGTTRPAQGATSVPNARAASDAARAQDPVAQQKKALQQQGLLPDATNSQNVPFCQDAYSNDPQGYMQAAQAATDAGIPWCPQTYAQDPQGYCQAVAQGYDPSAPQCPPQGPPPGYPPPQGYDLSQGQDQGQGDCCDWSDRGDCCYQDECFAAGAAPAGMGAAIGGIAGGILGTFAASPEIGAPIGAALGGAIQGGVCQASQGHGGGVNIGVRAPGVTHKTYAMGTTQVSLAGVYAPDGLFEPDGSNMQDPNGAKMATLVHTVNDELRKLKPGTSWGSGRGRADTRGAAQPQQAAVKGFFDLPRYATQFEGWTEDQLTDAADWVADKVSGPQEERFIVSGSGQKIYGPYQASTLQHLLQQLPAAGMSVSGGNPYVIDTHSHGVTLQAQANGDGTVSIVITGKNFYVSQGQVWSKLDDLMPQAGT